MALMIWFILVGCFNNYSKGADPDGDGVLWPEDCDDNDDAVNPDAVEVCNSQDDDCDGEVDEGVTTTYYADADGDGYGDLDAPVEACAETSGIVTNSEDCDDTNSTVNTAAEEVWYDGVDQDCRGGSDYDQDGDGFASATFPNQDGLVGPDCDDRNASVNPNGLEVWYDGVDQNCDGADDFDQDGDGFRSASHEDPDGEVGSDCDDEHASAYPGGTEICNTGIDEDCSGDDNGCGLSGEVLTADANYTITGEADTLFGWSLGSGDWNNDGIMDLAVGAITAESSTGPSNAGRVYVVYGPLPSDVTILTATDVLFEGVNTSAYLGEAVDGRGDLDGDGIADLIMGAAGYSEGGLTNNGAVAVMYGGSAWPATADMSATHAQFYGEVSASQFGQATRFIGDVNGDGFDDIAMGADQASDGGSVYIIRGGGDRYSGALNASNVKDNLILDGKPGDQLGELTTINGAFDLNGDGLNDIALGAWVCSEVYQYGGLVYILYGSETLPVGSRLSAWDTASARIQPEAVDDNLGHAIGTPGDMDGDGYDDLMIGARNSTNGHGSPVVDGKVYLILGGKESLSGNVGIASKATMTVTSSVSKDALGWMIEGGDVNNDGTADLVIGAPGYDHDGVLNSGAVFVFPGPLDGHLAPTDAEIVFAGPNISGGSEMGYSATVLDANGDGVIDVFIGATGASMVYGYLGAGL